MLQAPSAPLSVTQDSDTVFKIPAAIILWLVPESSIATQGGITDAEASGVVKAGVGASKGPCVSTPFVVGGTPIAAL